MKARGPDRPANLARLEDAFPTSWPCESWPLFQQRLLASLYELSGELWTAVRPVAERIGKTIEHQIYEEELDPLEPFRQAIGPLRVTDEEASPILGARAVFGRQRWSRLFQDGLGAQAAGVANTRARPGQGVASSARGKSRKNASGLSSSRRTMR